MSNSGHHYYSNVDKRWIQVVSKDDVLQVLVDNEWKRGNALLLSLDKVRVRLENSNVIRDVPCNYVKILDKSIKQSQMIPIEVNDLVTLQYDMEVVSAIVTRISSFIQLTVTSTKNIGKEITAQPGILRFVAKGYSLYDLPPIEGDFTIYKASSVDGKPMSPQQQKGANMLKPAGSISSSPANTQMNSGMALLYPAPCIIKAIPPCHDPESFPEAMAVQFPWRKNESPTILPVIRMGPGTMVVVVPSASGVGVMAAQGPVQVSVKPGP